MGQGCQITSGGGDSRDSATEINRMYVKVCVRVERCGKSAPLARQRPRPCKPHPMQDRIRLNWVPHPALVASLEPIGDYWPRKIIAYNRTRLIGLLISTYQLCPVNPGLNMEMYSSGRRGVPAKDVGRVTGAEVQILSSPIK